MSEPWKTPFECIDPQIGDQIWRLERSEPDLDWTAELEAHVSACHACRLLVSLDAKTRELARSGRLEGAATAPRPQSLRWARRRATWIAGLGLAACLAGVAFLPPRPVGAGSSVRGLDRIRFLRPVEGEVLATGRPLLRWTPIDGASRYLVEVRDRDGTSLWQGETPRPEIRLPGELSLTHGREYKALLSVQPADLVPPGHPSVLFRTGSPWSMLAHRLRWAHPLLQAATVLALGLVVLLGIRRHPGA